MNEFSSYHPVVNLVYFLFAIGYSMFFMHPLCLIISLASSFVYSVLQRGIGTVKKNLLYMIPMTLATALLNPLFNHKGVTILAYLPGGNPLTLESVIYGVFSAFMLSAVICRFSSYCLVMTSDKLIYLFGKILPSLSLVLSMTLRFVPEFLRKFHDTINAQRCIGRDISSGRLMQRAKNGLSVLSVMITRSLENSIDTADSMKARGYGLTGRTSFSVFRFDKRDSAVLAVTFILGIYVFIGNLAGAMDFIYFPAVSASEISIYSVSVFAAYFALCFLPVIIELWEVKRWNASRSGI